jgi:hypothetical protein
MAGSLLGSYEDPADPEDGPSLLSITFKVTKPERNREVCIDRSSHGVQTEKTKVGGEESEDEVYQSCGVLPRLRPSPRQVSHRCGEKFKTEASCGDTSKASVKAEGKGRCV